MSKPTEKLSDLIKKLIKSSSSILQYPNPIKMIPATVDNVTDFTKKLYIVEKSTFATTEQPDLYIPLKYHTFF